MAGDDRTTEGGAGGSQDSRPWHGVYGQETSERASRYNAFARVIVHHRVDIPHQEIRMSWTALKVRGTTEGTTPVRIPADPPSMFLERVVPGDEEE